MDARPQESMGPNIVVRKTSNCALRHAPSMLMSNFAIGFTRLSTSSQKWLIPPLLRLSSLVICLAGPELPFPYAPFPSLSSASAWPLLSQAPGAVVIWCNVRLDVWTA